jgi:quinol monooxygenase YgiN
MLMSTPEAMIHAMVRMDLNTNRHAEALKILHSAAGRIRTKSGCVSCSVYRDTEKRHVIVFEEYWKDKDKMHQHLRSQDYQSVLLVMDMAQKEPEIRFHTIINITGVETVEMARLGHPDMNHPDEDSALKAI